MKITTNIDGKDITIKLTQEQLDEIRRQSEVSYKSIDSYEDACKILSVRAQRYEQFSFVQDWYYHQWRTIVEAVNYLENGGKRWAPNWNNSLEYKYTPYYDRSGGVVGVFCWCYGRYCPAGVYFKTEKSAKFITNKFSELFKNFLGV